ncbi:hypothetical protein ACKI1L_38425, partial [Streptomyces scabiei]|uniref:hypothetical protein n=1 Tax=Streptomyces scabiei TaxID=1930 RepID=UPI0038F6FC56
TRIDPGTLDNFSRTRLEGQFQGLLTGFAVSDSKQAQFQGFSFSSAAFRSWYGGGAQNIEWGRDQTTITLPKPDLKEFTVD